MWLLSILFRSFLVAFSGALMPGPVTVTAVERATRGGVRAATCVAVGHSILELFLTILLAVGLLSVNAPMLKAVVGVIGGAVLVWMGVGMTRSARTAELVKATGQASSQAGWRAMVAGVVTSLSNPYWFLWWFTIGTTFVASASERGVGGITAFYLGHISGDIVWLAALGFAVAKGSALMSARAYRGLLLACAVLLIVFGMLFLAAGLIAASRI
jgi:threonine/homoserine/homoserine lactone efflux protein